MAHKFAPYPRYIFRKRVARSLILQHVPRGSRFLDIGCASGDFGFTLERLGYRGTLIDFSGEAAAAVREALSGGAHPGITFRQQDLFDVTDAEQYDFVTAFEVLEHIDDDRAAAMKVASLVRTGGWVLVSVPAKKKLWGASDVAVGHFRRYERGELRGLLEGVGLSVVTLYSYGFPFLNVIKVGRDIMYRRKLRGDIGQQNIRTRTTGSGMHQVQRRTLRWMSSEAFWRPFIAFSNLFNRFDLTEGYLCLAKKA